MVVADSLPRVKSIFFTTSLQKIICSESFGNWFCNKTVFLCVVVFLPLFNDDLCFPEDVKDLAIQWIGSLKTRINL